MKLGLLHIRQFFFTTSGIKDTPQPLALPGEILEIIRGSKCIDLLVTCTVHNKLTIFDQGLLMSVNCVHKPSSALNCSINFRGQKSKRNYSRTHSSVVRLRLTFRPSAMALPPSSEIPLFLRL